MMLLALAATTWTATAKVRLPQLFQSGMVVQRNKPIPVWGTADARQQVTVRWQRRQYTTQAAADGSWRLDLPPAKAGGPYILEVSGEPADAIVLTDVLVGDVWLCSGQSNVDIPIERVYPQYPDEIDLFDLPKVRLFRVQNDVNLNVPQRDIKPTPTAWLPLNKQNAWEFSALGTFLGQCMFQQYGVPQGIIVNSWGGTPIEAWISADSLQHDYPLSVMKTRLYQDTAMVAAQQKANQQADRRWRQLLDAADPGVSQQFTAPDFDDSQWTVVNQHDWQWPHVGSVWLRQHVHVDKAHAALPARLWLGTLFDADFTYVNGREVGRTYYQYPPRRYDLPAGLLHEGDNVITIRFINKFGAAHFIPEKPYMISFGDDREHLNPLPADVITLSPQWLKHDGAFMPACPSGDVSLQNMATTLYNAILHPLAPYALAGVVWYQGESNTGQPGQYGDLLQKLMACWRTLWQQPALPFCIVQLANFMQPTDKPQQSNWAALREAQRTVTVRDPYTELACLIDLGETVDIHPLRKREAAQRVALCFDRLVFGRKVTLSPQPVTTRSAADGQHLVVTFDQPLRPGAVTGFEVAGQDGRFVNAQAEANGTEVRVTVPVASPRAVRYAWKDNPLDANLRGKNDLPAVPFETTVTNQ